MSIKEFEAEYRDAMSETLNELQTVVLLLAHAEYKITQIGNSVQTLSQRLEEFVSEKQTDASM